MRQIRWRVELGKRTALPPPVQTQDGGCPSVASISQNPSPAHCYETPLRGKEGGYLLARPIDLILGTETQHWLGWVSPARAM